MRLNETANKKNDRTRISILVAGSDAEEEYRALEDQGLLYNAQLKVIPDTTPEA